MKFLPFFSPYFMKLHKHECNISYDVHVCKSYESFNIFIMAAKLKILKGFKWCSGAQKKACETFVSLLHFRNYRYSTIYLVISMLMTNKNRVHEICQSCQTWPAKFQQILLRTDTSFVFCNRKLMRTDIFLTGTTKPIYHLVNPVKKIVKKKQNVCVVLPVMVNLIKKYASLSR